MTETKKARLQGATKPGGFIMTTTIIINEQHSLMPAQAQLLAEQFAAGFDTLLVPAAGWNRYEMKEVMLTLKGTVVFVSPIPLMISALSYASAGWDLVESQCINHKPSQYMVDRVWVMCNDKREKKELPGGRIVHVVAKTGWYLA